MFINTEDFPIKLGVLIIELIHIVPEGVQGYGFHTINCFQFLPGLFRNGSDTLGNRIPVHFVNILILMQLHGHHIVTGTDQVFLDLLVGTLNGGDDCDDGGNADDDAKHGQHASHLMAPDALEGQADILFHSLPSF